MHDGFMFINKDPGYHTYMYRHVCVRVSISNSWKHLYMCTGVKLILTTLITPLQVLILELLVTS